MFATIFVGIFNLQDGKLTYVNCGNEPPVVLRASGNVALLGSTGPVVGILPEARYVVKDIVMEKSDLIVIFTDGIPDARNNDNLAYGREPVFDMISGSSKTASHTLEKLVENLHQFIGTAKQFDDITLLAVKRNV